MTVFLPVIGSLRIYHVAQNLHQSLSRKIFLGSNSRRKSFQKLKFPSSVSLLTQQILLFYVSDPHGGKSANVSDFMYAGLTHGNISGHQREIKRSLLDDRR